MLRLSRPNAAEQPAPSAAIARARLRSALGAQRGPAARLATPPATCAAEQPASHADELLGRLLREAITPAGGRP